MEWLVWCEHQLWQEAWNALTYEKQDQCDDMTRAYKDAKEQQHLHRLHLQHAHNTREYNIPNMLYFVDAFDATSRWCMNSWGGSSSGVVQNLTIGTMTSAWLISISPLWNISTASVSSTATSWSSGNVPGSSKRRVTPKSPSS